MKLKLKWKSFFLVFLCGTISGRIVGQLSHSDPYLIYTGIMVSIAVSTAHIAYLLEEARKDKKENTLKDSIEE